MLATNETVLYGSTGVCKVIGTSEKAVSGNLVLYYVLKPIYSDNSTIFVPIDSEQLGKKMQPVLSAEEVFELIHSMPDEETIWIDDENTRKAEYKSILSSGDRRSLVQLIKTLYMRQEHLVSCGKKLHIADERSMKTAEKMLYEEFAHVLDIDPCDVLDFINEQLRVKEAN